MASFRCRARRVAFPDHTEHERGNIRRSSSLPTPPPDSPPSNSLEKPTTTTHHKRTNRVLRFPTTTHLDTLTDALERDGCVILHQYTTPTTISSLDALTSAYISKQQYRPLKSLIRQVPSASTLTRDPTYRDLCSTFLTLHTTSYSNTTPQRQTSRPHISSSTAHMLPNYTAESSFHRADAHTHSAHLNVDRYERERDTMLGVLVPGAARQRTKGLVRVIPGSHLWGDEQPDVRGGGIVDVELEAGDALIVLGSLYWCLGADGLSKSTDSTMLYSIWNVSGVYRAEDEDAGR